MNAEKMFESEKTTMLQRLVQHRVGASDELMSDQDVISEHMGHLSVLSLLIIPEY